MLYPSAKALVFHPSRPYELLMLRRNEYYEPAGGKVWVNFARKEAEDLEACAIRECKEELGATVEISRYLGSYYFFWTRLPDCASVCVLYSAQLIHLDENQLMEQDHAGFPMEPVWVNVHDIINGNTPINSSFIGLEPLVKKFAELQLLIGPSREVVSTEE